VRVGVAVVVAAALRAEGGKQRLMDRQFPEGEMKPTGWFASLYGATSPWLGRWLYALFARRLDLQPEDEVLDVGCGSGGFLRIYGAHVKRIAGIDHSEDLVEIALRRNRERVAAGTAEFVAGDATDLPWGENEFTVVTSNCIGCFPDKANPALAEMYRVLRPGGLALVSDDYRDDMESVGFSRVSVEHIGWGDLTTGYKEAG
jgi:SAM-dependent methyltransferase